MLRGKPTAVRDEIQRLTKTDQAEEEWRDTAAESFRELLRRDGVLRNVDAKLTALTDGVSSDIFRVDDGGDSFVVKRALPRLRVREEWTANVDRNRYEQEYIEYVARFMPQSVPTLRSGQRGRGYFAMELLGPEFVSWKKLLLSGQANVEHAEMAASLLGTIHARSAGDADAAAHFDTTGNFIELRIDPYLLRTASRHPDLEPLLRAEAQRLAATKICLVHGDFSPKNIMISPSRFLLLDCEVAWYGDPAFDVAFLLTHLLLKGLYHAPQQIGLHEMSEAFWRGYAEKARAALDSRELEPRVARLLLALLLARVDGKSPVEYLASPQKQAWVRDFTRPALLSGCSNLRELFERWFAELRRMETWA
jgi:aminoglycoside phosphotransferase (APT) family kinase protein